MELALLIALLFCVALFVYALRVTGERNRLEREVAIWRDGTSGITISFDSATILDDSPRQRQERAAKILADLQRVSPLGRRASRSNDKPKRRK
jgi:hypothetical protein